MPTFQYIPLAGGTAPRTIEASDRGSALRALAARGETPRSIEQVKQGAKRAGGGSLRLGGGMSRSQLGSFMRELATAVNAGLPVVQALNTIRSSGRNEAQRAALETIIEQVEQGDGLGEAMGRVGKPFDDMVVSLVSAGETAGRLGETLDQSATLIDREMKLKRQLVGALVYPAIVLSLVILAVIVVVTIIVPRVLATVESTGRLAELPWPTMVVQNTAFFFAHYWWAVGIGVALLALGWNNAYQTPSSRLAIDRFVLRVPVVGPLIRDVAVARFTRTLGTLVAAGLPVLRALSITKGTLGNKALEEAVSGVSERVSEGKTIADPMQRSGYFPPLLVQLVAMGERTGRLDELLMQAAVAFEEKTEQGIALFTKVLPPLLIVVLAGLVGFVLLAILLPLLELQDAIAG
jgi:type IV pilus assembly protein PilC